MYKFYKKLSGKKFFHFFLESRNAGLVVLKCIMLLVIPYAWLFILSAIFGGLIKNFMVPEMAPVIIVSSCLILLFNLFLLVGAIVIGSCKGKHDLQ